MTEATLGDVGRHDALPRHDVHKAGIVPDVRQDVREVPGVPLRVVREVRCERHIRAVEGLLDLQLVLERRQGLVDVPLTHEREQPVLRVEPRRHSRGIEVVREEELH